MNNNEILYMALAINTRGTYYVRKVGSKRKNTSAI